MWLLHTVVAIAVLNTNQEWELKCTRFWIAANKRTKRRLKRYWVIHIFIYEKDIITPILGHIFFLETMSAENSSDRPKGSKDLALIVPQYTFDGKTHDLVKSTGTQELSSILNRVSIQNGICCIEDSDGNNNTPDLKDAVYEDTRPHFIGNSRRIIEIYKALYENQAISNVSSTEWVMSRLSNWLETPFL